MSTETTNMTAVDSSLYELAVKFQDQAKNAQRDLDKGYLDLAEALFEIKHKELYREFGIPTFQNYIEGVLDMEYGKCHALTKIWDSIKSLGLPREELERMGWTKARIACSAMDESNAEEILEAAKTMSRKDLQSYVSRRGGGNYDKADALILKFPADSANTRIIVEALDIGKRNFETEDPHTALAAILTEWMATNGLSPEKVPVDTFLRLLNRVYGGKFIHMVEQPSEEVYEDYTDDFDTLASEEIDE